MIEKLLADFLPIDLKAIRSDGFYKDFYSAKRKDSERISNGSGWRTLSLCPICKSSKSNVEFVSLETNIMRCSNCRHGYTERIPNNLDEVYDSPEYYEAVESTELKQKVYRMNRFGRERVEIIKNLFPDTNRTVLDVGSGWGYFLYFLKQAGFACIGIEPSKSLAEASRKEFSLDVVESPIEMYKPELHFDAITLFGVIEHVVDPVEILRYCARLLKNEGYVIIFTPNFDSVAVKIQKADANMIYPGQHLHHFCQQSIEVASQLANLSVFSYCTKGIDIGDLYGYSLYETKREIASFFIDHFEVFQSIIDHTECANHMRVILKKN